MLNKRVNYFSLLGLVKLVPPLEFPKLQNFAQNLTPSQSVRKQIIILPFTIASSKNYYLPLTISCSQNYHISLESGNRALQLKITAKSHKKDVILPRSRHGYELHKFNIV